MFIAKQGGGGTKKNTDSISVISVTLRERRHYHLWTHTRLLRKDVRRVWSRRALGCPASPLWRPGGGSQGGRPAWDRPPRLQSGLCRRAVSTRPRTGVGEGRPGLPASDLSQPLFGHRGNPSGEAAGIATALADNALPLRVHRGHPAPGSKDHGCAEPAAC